MKKTFGSGLFILFIACGCLKAQKYDSLRLTRSELSHNDSLNIFLLMDSLIALEESLPGSQLSVRLAYNSNVLSAGRTLGIEQFGLSPGIAYYHSSGFYADVSSYWSKDFDPGYYLTILSGGYIHSFTKAFSVIAAYDRYVYNTDIEDAYIPYKNTFTVSPWLDLKWVSFRADYAYYFGDDEAHRIMPSVSLNLEKKGLLKMDKIAFSPAAYFLFGDEKLTDIEIIYPDSRAEALQNYIQYGTPYKIVTIEKQVFGLMNYAFSFPLFVWYKKWSFNFSYTYSIPRALDDEPLLLEETSFLAGAITYTIGFKKKISKLFQL